MGLAERRPARVTLAAVWPTLTARGATSLPRGSSLTAVRERRRAAHQGGVTARPSPSVGRTPASAGTNQAAGGRLVPKTGTA